MSEGLETGWMPSTADGDNVLLAAVRNTAQRIGLVAESVGGRVDADDDAVLSLTGVPSVFANPAVLLGPLRDDRGAAFAARLRDLLGDVPALVMSPWPTSDLSQHGLTLFGHPPFMLRVAGGEAPPPPPELEVTEATDADALLDVETALVEGFPVELAERRPGSLFGPGLLGGPFRFWIGRVDGEPVATAAAMVAHGVVAVENVATLADHRGKGYGEALTWAATMADPTLPAVLIASDPGRPVYERMGYVPLFRWTLWGAMGG